MTHSRHLPSPVARTFRRGDPGYEEARLDTMWNARVPPRYPDIVVQAKDVYDVVAAVKQAKRDGMRIGLRSGGHSWAGNHVRDGGMLLDLSRMREVTIDKAAMRATSGPGRAGHELAKMLAAEKLFFPAGHCRGVAVGGFLLQGGFGWHGRTLGPACGSVLALDIVTADGDMVHASETENADLYWAARGSGPGFFGVVTRFHLRVYPRPKVIGLVLQSYPLSAFEELFRFAHRIGPEVSPLVELQLIVSNGAVGVRGPGIEVFAPVFADSLGQAKRALAFLGDSPLRRRAALWTPFLPSGIRLMYRGVEQHYPANHRYAVDNMWTHASIDALLPGLHKIAATMPPPPSHMLWLNWAPPKDRGPLAAKMAFSMEDDIYLGLYGVWKHRTDDGLHETWATERMREMEPLASGVQLADENLGVRPAKFVHGSNLKRLDEVRSLRDGEGRFHAWMGRP